jgi:predicted flavoprotein YhiN
MFPVSNSSQTIIDCFQSNSKLGISVLTGQSVQSILKENVWKIETQTENYLVEKLI